MGHARNYDEVVLVCTTASHVLAVLRRHRTPSQPFAFSSSEDDAGRWLIRPHDRQRRPGRQGGPVHGPATSNDFMTLVETREPRDGTWSRAALKADDGEWRTVAQREALLRVHDRTLVFVDRRCHTDEFKSPPEFPARRGALAEKATEAVRSGHAAIEIDGQGELTTRPRPAPAVRRGSTRAVHYGPQPGRPAPARE